MDAIQTENITKQYKNGVQALSGLTISVKAGEIFSLLGQNGAGKSTLIRILTTYMRPTSGEVTMLGKRRYTDAAWIRSKVACVSQQTSIDTHSGRSGHSKQQYLYHEGGKRGKTGYSQRAAIPSSGKYNSSTIYDGCRSQNT